MNIVNKIKLIAATIVACTVFAACGGGSSTASPAQNTPQPANDAVASVVDYSASTYATNTQYQCGFNTFDTYAQNALNAAHTDAVNSLKGRGWTNLLSYWDDQVTPSLISQSESASASLLEMIGHGAPGLIVFNHHMVWGPGSTSGQTECGVDNDDPNNPVLIMDSLGKNTSSMPITGWLHWIVAMTSDTVAGPSSTNTCSDGANWTSDWHPAFSKNNGSLHGIYGFWQHPLTLCGTFASQLTPDLNTGQDDLLLQDFHRLATNQNTPLSVHDAFVEAANDASVAAGNEWAIWEDIANRNEALTSIQSNLSVPSGTVDFYDSEVLKGISTTSRTTMCVGCGSADTQSTLTATYHPATVAVQNQMYRLHPMNLTNQSIDDSSKLSALRSYIDPNAAYLDNGMVREAYNKAYSIEHYYSGSGAILFHARIYDNPVAFDEPTALQAAENFVNQSMGLPSDAVLTSVVKLWKFSPSTSSEVQTGYEFIWQHSAPIFGGDAMKVIVTDQMMLHRYCTAFNPNDPPFNKPFCYAWQTTVTNTPYISYGNLLWRTQTSARTTLSTGQSATGQYSLSAYTASLSLPKSFAVTSYLFGYWTGGALDPTSTSKGLVPAWIFYDGQFGIAIDAASGALLGQV